MIVFDRVGFSYAGSDRLVLRDVDLDLPEGELVLVVGATGAGKSTLLGAVNGLVPHATGGRLVGRVAVDGLDTRTHPPRDLAHVVGWVGQDPAATFVTGSVEEELAYAMEQLAVPPPVMRTRVEQTLDLLGIADLRHRPLGALSGGQQQRVAIGAVLTAGPRVLVLDEPTSALDPGAAEEVLGALLRLVHDLGVTVLVAEHRLERVVEYADRVLLLDASGTVRDTDPTEAMRSSPVAPPVVELARLAGWSPPPLSVRGARRLATPLRAHLAAAAAVSPVNAGNRPDAGGTHPVGGRFAALTGQTAGRPSRQTAGLPSRQTVGRPSRQTVGQPSQTAGQPLLRARGVVVRHGATVAVRGVDVDVRAGETVAVMGRNGAGKSSLLWALAGALRVASGSVAVAGHEVGRAGAADRRRLVGLVPQAATDLLYLESVADECAQADAESRAPAGTCAALLGQLLAPVDPRRHPRDLSVGQQLGLVLAVQLTAAPPVVLLDEPTRGLDYGAKRRLVSTLRRLSRDGHAVVLASHDVELVAQAADRVLVLADGDLVADGSTADVVATSPTLAPQVAKVLGPPWLTVDAVAAALDRQPEAVTRG